MRYTYRGLPSTKRSWTVMGTRTLPGGDFECGVLEWCNSEADARTVMAQMVADPTFSRLKIIKVI